MSETVWRGVLRLSLASCPVRLAPATRETTPIRLDRLNGRTGNRLIIQSVDARTGDIVPPDVVIRGYKTPDAGYVRFANSELAALAGAANLVDVAHFCPAGRVDRARFDRGYHVYADGLLAAETLASLRLAMRRADVDAIAYLWLGQRERMALLAAHDAGLLLTTLRPPAVVEPAEFGEPPDDAVSSEMLEIAEGLIRRRLLEGDPNLLPDRYETRLRALIEAKTGESGAPSPAAAGELPEGVFDLDIIAAPSTAMTASPEVADQPLAAPADEPLLGREFGAEILLHIVGLGDRRFIEPGWAGSPGSRREIEAISIRPRDDLSASAIEFRVFAQHGRATAWVSDGNYAGTHDGQLPLTGFAVRAAPDQRDRLDIVYEGSFVDGGVVGPKMNGETCASPIDGDPLEAIRVSIVERADGAPVGL
jgi:DNA end-binding protein Ku